MNTEKPETLTQAYHAGIILAMAHNQFPDQKLPSFVEGAVHYPALRELFGEKLWQKLCGRAPFRRRINIYNRLTYQPGMPRSLIGTAEDFALGYVASYKRSSRKRELDARRFNDFNSSSVGVRK